MPVRLSEPRRNITVPPLDKGERARKRRRRAAGRESLKNPMHCSLAEGLPQISVGQRPTSRESKQTLSEGLHEPSAGQRPASRVPAALLSSFPKNHSRTVPRLKALRITARGNAPCFRSQFRHGCPTVGAAPFPHFTRKKKITVPLDKGERARACAGREPSLRLSPLIRGSGPASAAGAPREGSPRRRSPFPQKILPANFFWAEGLPDISTGQRPVNPPTPRVLCPKDFMKTCRYGNARDRRDSGSLTGMSFFFSSVITGRCPVLYSLRDCSPHSLSFSRAVPAENLTQSRRERRVKKAAKK